MAKNKYYWSEMNLTPCGRDGSQGPSLKECLKCYGWSRISTKHMFDVKPDQLGIQIIIIQTSGVYDIIAHGAGNQDKTGSGAIISGRFTLQKGDELMVAVGQKGSEGNYSCGSGGTFF